MLIQNGLGRYRVSLPRLIIDNVLYGKTEVCNMEAIILKLFDRIYFDKRFNSELYYDQIYNFCDKSDLVILILNYIKNNTRYNYEFDYVDKEDNTKIYKVNIRYKEPNIFVFTKYIK